MRKKLRFATAAALSLALVGSFALAGCSSSSQPAEQSSAKQAEPISLQVLAANSLSKAMEEVQAAYIEDGHDNVTFKDTQYKSSGELNEMLGAGASADLLISASKGSMDTPSKRAMLTSPPARICS